MNYAAFHFTVQPAEPGSEILIAMLSERGFESFVTTEEGFTGYITEEASRGLDLSDLSVEGTTFRYEKETIIHTNWNAEWEKSFDPVIINDDLCIRAHFHPPSHCKKEIVITPKMSFGTGHHSTTALMCRRILEHDLRGSRVLDMGCGTGVLAILAEMTGAETVVAIDNDGFSYENAKENCAINRTNRTSVRLGDADQLGRYAPFDFIFANINKNILKKHMPVYKEKLSAGGRLLLSGFFFTDKDEMTEFAASHGLRHTYDESNNEWMLLELAHSSK